MSETSLTRLCAWCGRTRTRTGEWRRAETLEPASDGRATHGICPECLERTAAAGEEATAP